MHKKLAKSERLLDEHEIEIIVQNAIDHFLEDQFKGVTLNEVQRISIEVLFKEKIKKYFQKNIQRR